MFKYLTLFSVTVTTLVQAYKDTTLSFHDIVYNYGYDMEEHFVTTKDGYVLKVFRIPGKMGDDPTDKPPVFLQHGICDSADSFVVREGQSPAFTLSNAGYDIWLGNSRGNKYSRAHNFFLPSDAAFWQYGFEEMGDYDIPAVIDYIIENTEFEKVAFVGHSMGST